MRRIFLASRKKLLVGFLVSTGPAARGGGVSSAGAGVEPVRLGS